MLALSSLLLSSTAHASVGTLPDYGPSVTVGSLPTGGTVIVRPASGAPVAAVELWYRAPSTGFASAAQPGMARLAAQAVAASKPIVGESVSRVIDAAGGRLAINVYGDSIAITATVPASAARTVVKALTTSYFAPVLTDDGFRSAERDVASEAYVATFDPETIVRDAVFANLFTSGPQHFPSLGDPKAIAAITQSDVRNFAMRAFRSGNATLVISGAIDASIATAAADGRPGDVSAETALNPDIAPSAGPVTRSAQPTGGGYGWVGPAIETQRDATAMDFIADYLFRPDDGLVTRQIADKYPDAFVAGQFITLNDPGVMFVAYSGKDMNSLKALVDDGFARVRKPLDARDFSVALAQFEYHIRSDLQTPTQVADNYGWYAVEGAAEYAPGANGERGAYFTYANGLTPDFVASVAEKYLGKPPATITLSPTAATKGGAL